MAPEEETSPSATLDRSFRENSGAIEGTRTPTPLRVHGPEPCASANSATMASVLRCGAAEAALMEETTPSILQRRRRVSNLQPRARNLCDRPSASPHRRNL